MKMIFSVQSKLILSSLMISACWAQDDAESTSPSPRLLSNQNSATLTAGALGLGIGVAGSLIVSKLIDDAAKCKPPAISKLFPLPDLLKFNPVNPDCNKQYYQTSNYRETQPSQYPNQYPSQYPSQGYEYVPGENLGHYPSASYPSQGYEVVPLSTFSQNAYQPAPVDLTPTLSYSQPTTTRAPVKQTSGFSQTSNYKPQPNPVRPSYPSPSPYPSPASSVPSQPEMSFIPNPAIQPRGLSDLFSPVASQSTQFSETEAVVPQVESLRTGKAVESGKVLFQPVAKTELNKKIIADSGFTQTEAITPQVDSLRSGKALEAQPLLFQPVAKTERNQKAAPSSGFSQTEAVTPSTDHFRNGKSLNSDALIEGRDIERLTQGQGFSETEAISPKPDVVRTGKQVKTNSGVRQILFRPVAQDKLPRRGKALAQAKTEPKPFSKSLSGLGHPVSAVADLSLSEPQTFTGGL